MIVKEGRHQTQRVLPTMALIQPVVAKGGLTLRAPNMPDLFISTTEFPKEVMECQ